MIVRPPTAGTPALQLLGSLPYNAYHGQEILFQTAAMFTSGYSPWHLRYNASASTNKWAVLSAAPMVARVSNSENSSSATLVDLATVGPSIAIPIAGQYECRWTTLANNVSANAVMRASLVNNVGALQGQEWYWQAYLASANGQIVGHEQLDLAAVTHRLMYRTDGGTSGGWAWRTLSITPLRVGG